MEENKKAVLMKGNEAIAEAAIRVGCQGYFGYPITPQTELMEYIARYLPSRGGVFIQAESEVAAINMVLGAASTGARVMTSSSSPGISLKMEGISYIAAQELPCLIVNVCRGGPGLGSVYPEQSDYFQATKGGGHGSYRLIVLAPASVQEAVELVMEGFDLADKYRNPVMLFADGVLGQMMEKVVFPEPKPRDMESVSKWALTGSQGRKRRIMTTLMLNPEELENHNFHLKRKYDEIEEKEVRCELYKCDSAEYFVVAFGTTSRVAKKSIDLARNEGIKVGLIRPITLFPFPKKIIKEIAAKAKAFLTVEMNTGQMVEDVQLAVLGRVPVYFHGRAGGCIPSPDELLEKIKDMTK